MSTAAPHKTAIQRWSLSRPVALALEDGLLSTKTAFFDYGCGRGGDLKRLHQMGVPVSGWDPAFFPDEDRTQADVVNLGYVVNVIEDPEERAVALCAAWELTQKLLIVSARLDWEARTVAGDFCGDGIVTGKRTFQRFFTQNELRGWIESTIGRSPVAAAPGVFYVFRDAPAEQTFLAHKATRPRRVPAVPLTDDLFREHRDALQPLIEFVDVHGRLPLEIELEVEATGTIVDVFGSIPRAFALVRRVTGAERWEAVRRARRDDLLVYLALAAFQERPKFGRLPDRLRLRHPGVLRHVQAGLRGSGPPAVLGGRSASRRPRLRRGVGRGKSCVTRYTFIKALWGTCIPCCGSTRAAAGSSPARSMAPP